MVLRNNGLKNKKHLDKRELYTARREVVGEWEMS